MSADNTPLHNLGIQESPSQEAPGLFNAVRSATDFGTTVYSTHVTEARYLRVGYACFNAPPMFDYLGRFADRRLGRIYASCAVRCNLAPSLCPLVWTSDPRPMASRKGCNDVGLGNSGWIGDRRSIDGPVVGGVTNTTSCDEAKG